MLALKVFEELGLANAETLNNFLECIESEIPVPFFYICEIAAIDAGHEGESLLSEIVLTAQLFYPLTNFVSYSRLFHSRRLLSDLYCYV